MLHYMGVPLPIEPRFWAKVDRSGGPSACWLWTGARNDAGYGMLSVRRRPTRAHRVAYELFVGPIPEGLEVRHTCDSVLCVNPSHLLAGTHAQNMGDVRDRRRSWQLRKTHCPQGHEYNEANTRVDPKGHRYCRRCTVEKVARQRARGVKYYRHTPEQRERHKLQEQARRARKRAESLG